MATQKLVRLDLEVEWSSDDILEGFWIFGNGIEGMHRPRTGSADPAHVRRAVSNAV